MPQSSFKKEREDLDIFEFVRTQDLGELKLEDPESRLLRHLVRRSDGYIVALVVADDPVADDSNSIEVVDPSVYWFFYDLAEKYEEAFPNKKTRLICRFKESQLPERPV